jgi:membrane protease YdiL (CAAX protease family)
LTLDDVDGIVGDMTTTPPVTSAPPAKPVIPPVHFETVPWKRIGLFVLASYAIFAVFAAPFWVLPGGTGNPLFTPVIAVGMFAPLFASVILAKGVEKTSWRTRVGLRFRGRGKQLLIWIPLALVIVVVLNTGSYAISALRGVPLDLTMFTYLGAAADELSAMTGTEVPVAAAAVSAVINTLIGLVITVLATLGEEVGWRGWLWPALRPLGPIRAAVVGGVIWGLWHDRPHRLQLHGRAALAGRPVHDPALHRHEPPVRRVHRAGGRQPSPRRRGSRGDQLDHGQHLPAPQHSGDHVRPELLRGHPAGNHLRRVHVHGRPAADPETARNPGPGACVSGGSGPMGERESLREELQLAAALCYEALSVDPRTTGTDSLASAAELLATAERSLHRLVGEARDAGMSWARIGEVLGVSRQAAQQRFAAAPARRVSVEKPAVPDQVLEVAAAVLEGMAAQDAAAVDPYLGDAVHSVLGPEGIAPQIEAVLSTFGTFDSREELQARMVGNVVMVRALEHRTRHDADVHVTLTRAGVVLGLRYEFAR